MNKVIKAAGVIIAVGGIGFIWGQALDILVLAQVGGATAASGVLIAFIGFFKLLAEMD